MKSRTSSFNPTVFRKDLTRFAPAWGCYLIMLLLALVSMSNASTAYYRVQSIRNTINAMGWINMIYAAMVAQLVFGDLYNSRLCNALHALPVTREGWFLSHTASGICFSLLPNLAAVIIGLPILRLGVGRSIGIWWLLATEMQYLFFFGTAVLCVMLSGNRLGHIALYGIVSFAGLLVYWIASAIYEPFLHGILIPEAPFQLFCPLAHIVQLTDVVEIVSTEAKDELGNYLYTELLSVALGEEGWAYMAICAGFGVATLAAALMLYRKRRLECAGDFVAFPCMEPVVTVIVTVFVGAIFHLFADAMGLNLRSVMLGAGMIVGFFGCRMLLARSTRVFRKKTILGCGAIIAVFGLSILLTILDPLGITRWVPEAEKVESVTVSESYSLSRHNDYPFTATETADIEQLLEVHRHGITKEASSQPVGTEEAYNTMTVRLEYKLKNGRVRNRFYEVHPHSEAGQILKRYFTRPECVLGFPAEKAHEMTGYIRSIYVDGMDQEIYNPDSLDLEAMMDAILADCNAGNMARFRGYHYPHNYDLLGEAYGEYDLGVCYVELSWDHEKLETALQGYSEANGIVSYSSIRVYRSCTNTLKWLEDNGLLTDEVKAYMTEKFGGVYKEFAIPTGN